MNCFIIIVSLSYMVILGATAAPSPPRRQSSTQFELIFTFCNNSLATFKHHKPLPTVACQVRETICVCPRPRCHQKMSYALHLCELNDQKISTQHMQFWTKIARSYKCKYVQVRDGKKWMQLVYRKQLHRGLVKTKIATIRIDEKLIRQLDCRKLAGSTKPGGQKRFSTAKHVAARKKPKVTTKVSNGRRLQARTTRRKPKFATVGSRPVIKTRKRKEPPKTLTVKPKAKSSTKGRKVATVRTTRKSKKAAGTTRKLRPSKGRLSKMGAVKRQSSASKDKSKRAKTTTPRRRFSKKSTTKKITRPRTKSNTKSRSRLRWAPTSKKANRSRAGTSKPTRVTKTRKRMSPSARYDRRRTSKRTRKCRAKGNRSCDEPIDSRMAHPVPISCVSSPRAIQASVICVNCPERDDIVIRRDIICVLTQMICGCSDRSQGCSSHPKLLVQYCDMSHISQQEFAHWLQECDATRHCDYTQIIGQTSRQIYPIFYAGFMYRAKFQASDFYLAPQKDTKEAFCRSKAGYTLFRDTPCLDPHLLPDAPDCVRAPRKCVFFFCQHTHFLCDNHTLHELERMSNPRIACSACGRGGYHDSENSFTPPRATEIDCELKQLLCKCKDLSTACSQKQYVHFMYCEIANNTENRQLLAEAQSQCNEASCNAKQAKPQFPMFDAVNAEEFLIYFDGVLQAGYSSYLGKTYKQTNSVSLAEYCKKQAGGGYEIVKCKTSACFAQIHNANLSIISCSDPGTCYTPDRTALAPNPYRASRMYKMVCTGCRNTTQGQVWKPMPVSSPINCHPDTVTCDRRCRRPQCSEAAEPHALDVCALSRFVPTTKQRLCNNMGCKYIQVIDMAESKLLLLYVNDTIYPGWMAEAFPEANNYLDAKMKATTYCGRVNREFGTNPVEVFGQLNPRCAALVLMDLHCSMCDGDITKLKAPTLNFALSCFLTNLPCECRSCPHSEMLCTPVCDVQHMFSDSNKFRALYDKCHANNCEFIQAKKGENLLLIQYRYSDKPEPSVTAGVVNMPTLNLKYYVADELPRSRICTAQKSGFSLARLEGCRTGCNYTYSLQIPSTPRFTTRTTTMAPGPKPYVIKKLGTKNTFTLRCTHPYNLELGIRHTTDIPSKYKEQYKSITCDRNELVCNTTCTAAECTAMPVLNVKFCNTSALNVSAWTLVRNMCQFSRKYRFVEAQDTEEDFYYFLYLENKYLTAGTFTDLSITGEYMTGYGVEGRLTLEQYCNKRQTTPVCLTKLELPIFGAYCFGDFDHDGAVTHFTVQCNLLQLTCECVDCATRKRVCLTVCSISHIEEPFFAQWNTTIRNASCEIIQTGNQQVRYPVLYERKTRLSHETFLFGGKTRYVRKGRKVEFEMYPGTKESFCATQGAGYRLAEPEFSSCSDTCEDPVTSAVSVVRLPWCNDVKVVKGSTRKDTYLISDVEVHAPANDFDRPVMSVEHTNYLLRIFTFPDVRLVCSDCGYLTQERANWPKFSEFDDSRNIFIEIFCTQKFVQCKCIGDPCGWAFLSEGNYFYLPICVMPYEFRPQWLQDGGKWKALCVSGNHGAQAPHYFRCQYPQGLTERNKTLLLYTCSNNIIYPGVHWTSPITPYRLDVPKTPDQICQDESLHHVLVPHPKDIPRMQTYEFKRICKNDGCKPD